MLVYVVGMQELKHGKPTSEPYYFGYTTNAKAANNYYRLLIEKEEDTYGPNDAYQSMYFIQKVSDTKFDEFRAKVGMIDEIMEYEGGAYMTESDFSSCMDTVMDEFNVINDLLQYGKDLPYAVDRINTFSKFIEDKKLRKNAKLLKLLIKYMREYFSDYNAIEGKVNLKKMHSVL